MSRPPRPLAERILDRAARAALRLPWPPNGRIAVAGLFGFLKQIARSRSRDAAHEAGRSG